MLQWSERKLHRRLGRPDHTRAICSQQIAASQANKCDASQKRTWRATGVITAAVLACCWWAKKRKKNRIWAKNLKVGVDTSSGSWCLSGVFIGYWGMLTQKPTCNNNNNNNNVTLYEQLQIWLKQLFQRHNTPETLSGFTAVKCCSISSTLSASVVNPVFLQAHNKYQCEQFRLNIGFILSNFINLKTKARMSLRCWWRALILSRENGALLRNP